MVFAFTVPKPECEALITTSFGGVDVSWPISSEAKAYQLAKQVGVPGFWRLKSRVQARHGEPTAP
jgi:hypothetical protein